MMRNIDGINQIDDMSKVTIGNYVYNNYTNTWYVVTELPNLINNDDSIFLLIRLDGRGYYLKCDSFEKLLKSLKFEDDIGEIEVYKSLDCN